jgi:predicted phage terminase large subunit-like protein
LPVVPVKVGQDKRARLRAVATFIQNGTVLFPEKGCEDLLAQLLGFGVEDHDDLVDAFVLMVLGLSKQGFGSQEAIALV